MLGSVTLTPSAFTNSFSPVTFDIKGLDLLSSATDVTDFSVALTSSTPHNKTYHIKGGDFAVDPATLVHIGTPLPHTQRRRRPGAVDAGAEPDRPGSAQLSPGQASPSCRLKRHRPSGEHLRRKPGPARSTSVRGLLRFRISHHAPGRA